MRTITSGYLPAKIMIVGDFPGVQDERDGRPFMGQSGNELTRMLLEAGINRNDAFITNVTHYRPPNNDIKKFFYGKRDAALRGIEGINGRYPAPEISEGLEILYKHIGECQPDLILAIGDTPLWALTGNSGIMDWRGSELEYQGTPLVPCIHPTNILRDWSFRHLTVNDLRRAKRYLDGTAPGRPAWKFHIRPSSDDVIKYCEQLAEIAVLEPLVLAADIETRRGQIACVGLGHHLEAMCIPFMQGAGSYWPTLEEELLVTLALRKLLTNPRIHLIFHNGNYDLQYFAKQWGYLPNMVHDTMIMQHVAFAGLRKSLAVCSSLYCQWHRFWKDDGKEWVEGMPEENLWTYNCEDIVRTYEVWTELTQVLIDLNLLEPYLFQTECLQPEVLRMMLRGVRIDLGRRMELDYKLEQEMKSILQWLEVALGHPLNPRSPVKMQQLFYDDFGVPKIFKRGTGKPTTDEEALNKIKLNYPTLRPLIEKINEYRSLGVFLGTFIRAPLSNDKRMRCSYNLTGTETYRFSSSEDAFGTGTNLQNIPKGDE